MDKLIGPLRVDGIRVEGPIGKARRLLQVWQCLDRHTQITLSAGYFPRVRWPQGYAALIGEDLASVAFAFPPDGDGHALSDPPVRLGV